MDDSPQVHVIKLIARFDLGFKSISARLILGGIFMVFVAHLALFVAGVPQTHMEQIFLSGETPYSVYGAVINSIGGLTGSTLYAGRVLSAFCALTAMALVAWYGRRVSGDEICGAVLPLGFVFFPPLAFVFSQATPHAVMVLLSVCVIVMVDGLSRTGKVGACLVAALIGAVVLAFGISMLSSVGDSSALDATSMSAVLLQPYAMLWVALGFTLLGLTASKALREVMTPSGVRRSLLHLGLFVVALVWALFVTGENSQSLGSTFTALFGFGLFAVLPMVIWIRKVMPRLRSILVWILLPVIMYSCFWVILWPIDLDGFPYNQLRLDDGLAGSKTPR